MIFGDLNGSLFLFKDKIKSFVSNDQIKEGKFYYGEITELDPRDCIYYRVNMKMDENEPGYCWDESGCAPDERKQWKPTDEIIYPTKSIIGTSRENPEIRDYSPETQRFRNGTYCKYTYDIFWDETKSGINLSEYGGLCYLDKEYWIKDKHYKRGTTITVFEPRKCSGSRSEFRLENVLGSRTSAIREQRLSKILTN